MLEDAITDRSENKHGSHRMKKPTKATRPSEVESTFPSPAEVERMCSEIQTHWSARPPSTIRGVSRAMVGANN